MEAASLCSSILPSLPHSSTKTQRLRRPSSVVFAARRDSYERNYRSGQLVDEGMIELRKRIHEMKVIERNYEPPADWADWEKQYYASYDEFICKLVGFLQTYLMNTRPSLALGMLALIAMSVPASTVMILTRLMEVADDALSAVHLG